MTANIFPDDPDRRRAIVLAAVILAQGLCGVFFAGDVIVDYSDEQGLDDIRLIFEAAAAVSLLAGAVVLMIELRRLLNRMNRMATGLRAARGEMASLVSGFFDGWGLTAAERDVALLLLKGFDNEAIARLRGVARGTVRAQCAAIYAKAGVTSRYELISIFLEELLADSRA